MPCGAEHEYHHGGEGEGEHHHHHKKKKHYSGWMIFGCVILVLIIVGFIWFSFGHGSKRCGGCLSPCRLSGCPDCSFCDFSHKKDKCKEERECDETSCKPKKKKVCFKKCEDDEWSCLQEPLTNLLSCLDTAGSDRAAVEECKSGFLAKGCRCGYERNCFALALNEYLECRTGENTEGECRLLFKDDVNKCKKSC
jgi:hypothetical protein